MFLLKVTYPAYNPFGSCSSISWKFFPAGDEGQGTSESGDFCDGQFVGDRINPSNFFEAIVNPFHRKG